MDYYLSEGLLRSTSYLVHSSPLCRIALTTHPKPVDEDKQEKLLDCDKDCKWLDIVEGV